MTTMALLVSLLLQAALIPSPPIPPPPPRKYAILGVGSRSCGEWMASRGTAAAPIYDGWLEGYLTALNAHGPNLVTSTPDDELRAAQKEMAVHCAEFPDQAIGWAANQASQAVHMGMARAPY